MVRLNRDARRSRDCCEQPLSGLAREENKKPASPEDLARNVQLFILFRTGIIRDCTPFNNTGKALSC
jgi:hypothetical protein